MMNIKVILFLMFMTAFVFAQENSFETRIGTVTFISSQNVYVKFNTTSNLEIGDTLFTKEGSKYTPALIVRFLSSSSAACELKIKKDVKVNDQIFAFIKRNESPQPIVKDSSENKQNLSSIIDTAAIIKSFKPERKMYRGRISVQSFSNMANFVQGGDDQRWRYSVMFNSDNIGGSAFSISNYFIFSYRNNELSEFGNNIPQFLKVYDFGIKYKIDESSELWGGRHLNNRISSISSIDGVQYEKNFSSFYAGAVAGARPDFNDMGFNFKLFEYGGYFGRIDSIDDGYMENTLAFIQQTNHFKTDRRFLYFQHSNNIYRTFNLFFSSEADLYQKVNDVPKNKFSLTSLFLSARYAPAREVSFSLSYDARKDVIYYETYRSFADSILDRETRQGLRGGVNLRLFNNLFAGLSAGYRFQKSDSRPASNYNVYLSYSLIPLIDVLPSASFTRLQSSYIDGTLYGVRLSKTLFNITDLSIEYQNTKYKFTQGDLLQQIFSVDLSTRIWEFFYFTASYEGTFESTRTWGRALFDFTARF